MIYILNHKSRRCGELVRSILNQGTDTGYVKVFTDQTDYYQTRDENRYKGVRDNYMNILTCHDTDPYKLIFHDDVSTPPIGSINHVLQFAPPDRLIAFFHPTNKSYTRAIEEGHHVLKTYSNWWGPAVAFPTSLIPRFMKWQDDHVEGVLSEDGLLWRFFSYEKIPVYVVMPALVQHDGFDKSIHGNPAKCGKNERRSSSFDQDFDVTKVDWEAEFAEPYIDPKKHLKPNGLKNLDKYEL